MPDDQTPGRSAGRYERQSTELEFVRVATFSDAVFAIAMTLLVVGIGIPHVRDSNFQTALTDKREEIFSFFLSFIVIGYYWLAHHRFFAQLRAVDVPFMQLNLLYLAAIAFTPFPTALVGIYVGHPVSIVLYALTLGVASFLEATLLWRAHRAGLMDVALRPDVFRYGILASLAPVLVFLLSIPVAFISTLWAVGTWILIFPLEMLVTRLFKPGDADQFL